jgi:CheY-like chemotaxis protein
MLLVTGPTGSGKTTTLYSALRHVQSSEKNVVTVEDPIEYRLEGINQVQVNERTGLTFASALRSILRQDPDVVLVGEIRDTETAGVAIKASMTGHLVLSTLHTNDAPSAVARLADIGVEMGALAGALKGIMAQRLVRRLCAECSEPISLSDLPPDQQVLLAGRSCEGLRRPVGCAACRGTGYRGRTVVPEIAVVTPEMQRAIARGASVSELGEMARAAGMRTLWEAGLERVVSGITSLHELLDNIAAPILDSDESTSQDVVDALLDRLLSGPASPAAAEPRAIAPAANNSGERVLLVDDDRAARRELRSALEREGFGVIEAADGEAALAYARRLRPGRVICELALPRLDGVGLVQALAHLPEAPPVLVYTDQRDIALLDWACEVGASGVASKTDGAPAVLRWLRSGATRAAA